MGLSWEDHPAQGPQSECKYKKSSPCLSPRIVRIQTISTLMEMVLKIF